MTPDIHERVDAVVAFYESLTPERLSDIPSLYTPEASFTDPFNDVRGIDAIRRIFVHMFDQVEGPHFRIVKRLVEGRSAMIEWRFLFALRGRTVEVSGVSVLDFDADGRVERHRDFWDAAGELYAKLPVIGWIVRRVGSRLSAQGEG